jgi:hypothetical protein
MSDPSCGLQRKNRRYLVPLGVCLAIALLIATAVVTDKRPRPHMSAKEAEIFAYEQLDLYCDEYRGKPYDLDIKRFAEPKIVSGSVAEYDPARRRDCYVPTWDFYYRYPDRPSITVLVSYISENASTEVVWVFKPHQKKPVSPWP